ncbi:hypothetical protein LJC34_06540 [Oscillospiraceae bacterium OttesenSCG-928-G22]|nr:hypothetical protein [Oscillospiraceae bacterium OttesenSCG-928-G22]
MFYVESAPKALKVYFNNSLVLSHTSSAPFVAVETGEDVSKTGPLARVFSSVFSKHRALTDARYDENRHLLRFSHGDLSISFALVEHEGALLLKPHKYTEDIAKLRFRFPATPGEPVFGAGAVHQSVDLRGKKISLYTGDRGSYGSISKPDVLGDLLKKGEIGVSSFTAPFFLSSDFSSVYFDFPGHIQFDFTNGTSHIAETSGVPEVIALTAPAAPDAYFKQLRKSGRTASLVPPSWCTEGLLVGISGGATQMLETIDRHKRAGVSISGLFVRDWSGIRGDSGEVEFWDWIWNRDYYPHLDEVMQQLSSRGIRTLGYVNPHFCIEGQLFAEASHEGYLIKNKEGANYLSDMGGFIAGHLDLTNESAQKWFTHIIHDNMIALGFSGYFADRGGYLPSGCVLSSGDAPDEIHNKWAALWSKLNHDAIKSCKKRDLFLFTAAGAAGAPTMSALADGSGVDWTHGHGLLSVLNEMLSLGFSGIGVSHCDAGVYAHSIPERYLKEQLIRWSEFAAFAPVMQSHSLHNPPLDSIRSDDVLFHLARMSKLHRMLAPYFSEVLRAYTLTGLPVLRHMRIAFPDHTGLRNDASQFMVGEELLVAPILRADETERNVTLPEGDWIHMLSGQAYASGAHTIDCPLGSPAAFYRKGGAFERVLGSVAYNLV